MNQKLVFRSWFVCSLACIVFASSMVLAQDPIYLLPKQKNSRKVKTPPAKATITATPELSTASPQVTFALSTALVKELDYVLLPALQNNSDAVFLKSLIRLTDGSPANKLQAIDKHVNAKGQSIKKRYVELLIQAFSNGEDPAVPNLKIDAVEFLQTGIHEKIREQLNDLTQFRVMQDPCVIPGDWRDTENLFWDIRVWTRDIQLASQLARYSEALQANMLKFAEKKNDEKNGQPVTACGQAGRDGGRTASRASRTRSGAANFGTRACRSDVEGWRRIDQSSLRRARFGKAW